MAVFLIVSSFSFPLSSSSEIGCFRILLAMDPGDGYASFLASCLLYSLVVFTLHLALFSRIPPSVCHPRHSGLQSVVPFYHNLVTARLNPRNHSTPERPEPSIYQSPIATSLSPCLCPRVCTYSSFRFPFSFPFCDSGSIPPLACPLNIPPQHQKKEEAQKRTNKTRTVRTP